MTVALRSDPGSEGQIRGTLRLEGPLAHATALFFEPVHDMALGSVEASDETGVVPLEKQTEGKRTRFTLGRATRGALDVRWSVRQGAPSDDPTSPRIEPIEFHGSGEDLLVLPEVEGPTSEPLSIALDLETGGSSINAASSFGLGTKQHVRARVAELRAAYFLAGDIGTAAFHTSYGDDMAGWLGPTLFDGRWVSAEAAGVRTAIDEYMGRAPTSSSPPVVTLLTSVKAGIRPATVVRRARGLAVFVDRRATWSSGPRLLVAQALVQRYLGGALAVGDRSRPAEGSFFHDGFSRAVAREILFAQGIFDHADRAAEVNTLLASTDFADEPERFAARGALLATALDLALQRDPDAAEPSLAKFLRAMLLEAETDLRSSLRREDFVARVERSAGNDFARDFAAGLSGASEIALPPNLLGKCYRLERRVLVPFELGFVTSTGETMSIVSVKAGSHADAAGLRVGDTVEGLHYQDGRSTVPVEISVKRGERALKLRFTPAGPAKQGRVFERVPKIPNEQC